MTLSNNWITGLGAVLAILQYLQGVGAKAPATKWEWLQTAIAAGIAGLGFYLKSLTVSTKTPVILLALALTGCASPYGLAGSAEQLKELIKIKDAMSFCTVANTPWGTVRSTMTSIDITKVAGATATADGDCKQTLTVTQPEKKTP